MVASVEHDIVNGKDRIAKRALLAVRKSQVTGWNVDVKIYDIMDGI